MRQLKALHERAKAFLQKWCGIMSTVIICGGICAQAWKIILVGDSHQISGWDLTLRTIASLLWLLQYHVLNVRRLIWCQRVFLAIYLSYVGIVMYFWCYPTLPKL